MFRDKKYRRELIILFALTITMMTFFFYSTPNKPNVFDVENAPCSINNTVYHYNSITNTSKLNLTGDKPVHFLIFDATRYRGNLQFLDGLSSKWIVLVVNSAKKSQLESCRKCVVVDRSITHLFLNGEMASKVWNQVPRYAKQKAIAILYALWNSAEWLYVTESEFLPDEDTLLSTCSHKPRSAPVYRGPKSVYEPCEHFMDPYTWYGLETPKVPQGLYSVKAVATDAIHMVVNGCYREDMDNDSWKKGMDTQAPHPHVMAGTFSSIDFRNVIVSRKMVWALVASLTMRSYESEFLDRQSLLLNLMVQRIVWDSNGTIGFMPTARFPDISECSSCDMNNSLKTIRQSQLHGFTNWRCKSSNNLIECLEQLANDFQLLTTSKRGNSELQILFTAWLDLFSSQGVPIVTRVPLTNARLSEKDKGIHLQFTPAKSMHVLSPNSSLPQNDFTDLCETENGTNYSPYIPKDHLISDILLIIIFNQQVYVGHIAKLEYIYGRHFKHVIYCAESKKDFDTFYASKYPRNPVSFVEVPTRGGYFGQNCMATAINIGYQVSGYLQISDDVLLNVWNLHTMPRSLPWFQTNIWVAHVDRNRVPDENSNRGWAPWGMLFAHRHALKVYNKLLDLQSAPETMERVSALLRNLYNFNGCDRCINHGVSDIFYVPVSLAADFAFFSNVFSHPEVFLEVAIPTILTGLAKDGAIYRLRGNYLWAERREAYKKFYDQSDHFLHPWKFSTMFSNPNHTSFFCQKVIARIDEDLKKSDGDNS